MAHNNSLKSTPHPPSTPPWAPSSPIPTCQASTTPSPAGTSSPPPPPPPPAAPTGPPFLVLVDAGVWARSGPPVRALVVRKAYNQRMWLRNGRTRMKRVRVERVGGLEAVAWVKAGVFWETVVGRVVEYGMLLGEEGRVHLAAMERDLRRDGVVSQQTRDLMRL